MSRCTPTWVRHGRYALALITSLLVAAMLVAAAATWAFAGAASAHFVGNGHYVRGVGSENSHGFWLGALETANNLGQSEPSFCVTMWNGSPSVDQDAQTRILTEPTMQAPAGLALSAPEMAYAISQHYAEGGADSRAALAYLAHMNFEGETLGFDRASSVQRLTSIVQEQQPQVHSLAQQYVQEAQRDTPREYESGVLEASGSHGTYSGLGVRSSQGWTPRIPMTVTLDGPAVFTSTGTSQWEGVSSDVPLSLEWQSTGSGSLAANVTYHEVPRQTLTLAIVGGRYQDLLTLAGRPDNDPSKRRGETQAVTVTQEFQPMARSNVGELKIVDHTPEGATIGDTLEVFMQENRGQWPSVNGSYAPVVFHGTAYTMDKPLEQASEQIPAGAQAIGMATITAAGPGKYEANIQVTAPGFITWVWEMKKNDPAHDIMTDQGKKLSELIQADWRDAYGLGEETLSVRSLLRTDSALSVRETQSATYLVDDLYVYGFPQDHGNFAGNEYFKADRPKMQQSLYFFPAGMEIQQETLAKATHIATIDVPAIGGFHPSIGANEFKALEGNPEGTYVFVTSFEGDSRVAPYQSRVDDQREWYVVESPRPPSPPADNDGIDSPESKRNDPPRSGEPSQQPPDPQGDQPQSHQNTPKVNPSAPKNESPSAPQAAPESPRAGHVAPAGVQAGPLPQPLAKTGASNVLFMVLGALGSVGTGVGMVKMRRRRAA